MPFKKAFVYATIHHHNQHINFCALYWNWQKADTRLFAELINGNPNEEIVKSLQTASKEFKERLPLLDIIGERVYPLKQFFNQIPTGQHYWFLPGRIEDRI